MVVVILIFSIILIWVIFVLLFFCGQRSATFEWESGKQQDAKSDQCNGLEQDWLVDAMPTLGITISLSLAGSGDSNIDGGHSLHCM
jgi:hypothetical protein